MTDFTLKDLNKLHKKVADQLFEAEKENLKYLKRIDKAIKRASRKVFVEKPARKKK